MLEISSNLICLLTKKIFLALKVSHPQHGTIVIRDGEIVIQIVPYLADCSIFKLTVAFIFASLSHSQFLQFRRCISIALTFCVFENLMTQTSGRFNFHEHHRNLLQASSLLYLVTLA